MKPSWNDAPEWAQWLAQDMIGEWWFFVHEPIQCWDTLGGFWNDPTGSQSKSYCHEDGYISNHNWQSTLEKRPQTDTKG